MRTVARRRLVIFGINYAPEQTGIGVNTTGLAESLPGYGWDVTVVTGVPHYPTWTRQPVPASSTDPPATVIRRSHYIPHRHSVLHRAGYELTWLANSLPLLAPRRPVDLVVGVVPSLGGAVLAAAASRRYGVPYVVMFYDLLGKAVHQSGYRGARRVGGLVRGVEIGLARRAAAITVVAEGFRHYLIEGGVPAHRIERVRNPVRMLSPTRERSLTRAGLGWGEAEVVVLHSGNMGHKQALENVLEAADLARSDTRIRFVLQGDGNRRAHLEEMARRLALPNVTFLPLASNEEFANILVAADMLLVNQAGEVKDMSLPAKITSYFAVGVPVIAAVAAESETGREVAACGGGVVVAPEQPRALLDAVEKLAADPGLRARLGKAGRRFATTELRPETTASEFNRVLEGTLNSHLADGGITTEVAGR